MGSRGALGPVDPTRGRLPAPRRPRPARLLSLAGALAALLLATGCGGDRGGDRLPAPGSEEVGSVAGSAVPATSTDGAGSGLESDARVLADYAAYWDAVIDAYADSDWRSGRLAQHATGTQLDFLRNDLLANLTKGRVARGRPRLFGAEIERRSEDKAAVRDCIDSNRWLLYDATTGELADTPSGKHYRVTATLRLEGQRWKVADVNYKEERCGA